MIDVSTQSFVVNGTKGRTHKAAMKNVEAERDQGIICKMSVYDDSKIVQEICEYYDEGFVEVQGRMVTG